MATKSKFKITQAPMLLSSLGIHYFETGTIETKNNGDIFDFYKVDSITAEEKEAIKEHCSDVNFMVSSPSFAPELTRGLICFPKAAYYRLTDRQKENLGVV